jgi:hypothetical protein
MWRESSVVKSTMEDRGVAANGGYDAGGWGDYANAVAGKIGAVLFAGCVAGVEGEGKDEQEECGEKSVMLNEGLKLFTRTQPKIKWRAVDEATKKAKYCQRRLRHSCSFAVQSCKLAARPYPRKQVHMKATVLNGVIVCLLLVLNRAEADLVYTSGTPNLTGSGLNAYSSVAAESFTLANTTIIAGVRFFDQEFPPAWDGTLDYFFFSNSGFFPSASPLPGGSGHNPVFTKTALINGGAVSVWGMQYDFNLSTPLTLGPGTYWLGLHLQSGFAQGTPLWTGTTTPNAQVSAAAPGGNFNNWQLQGLQLAFSLSDTPLVVPEPASVIFIGIVLAALCGKGALVRNNQSKAGSQAMRRGHTAEGCQGESSERV